VRVLDNQRLAVFDRCGTSSRITVVPDRRGALEPSYYFGVEDIGHQTHAAMGDKDLAVG
jgi:hypothetical protein